MYGLFGFVEILNILKWANSTGNCVHYKYRMFGFTEKLNSADTLNAQNYVNPMGNYVH